MHVLIDARMKQEVADDVGVAMRRNRKTNSRWLEVAAVKVVGGCSDVSVSGWHQGRRALFVMVEGASMGTTKPLSCVKGSNRRVQCD
ncbi:hypothetical protein VIGAN_02209700 [Vigna angularis var. angularis]|uniref:Uncharacterized protein n=1 Tax=Vigna angularis var. angularis TaxID=157739 RepID=A0A0S3RFC8_PHAAN|nr:hypothetical protein VIGAN_02209700 [Vigna angularis var. angularis]